MASGLPGRVDRLERELNLLQRWSSKRVIHLSGPATRRIPGESDLARLQRLAWEYWRIQLDPVEVAQVHPVGKRAMVAEFVHRFEGSSFHRLLTNKPEWLGRPPIYARLFLVSRADKKLAKIARLMKSKGEIKEHAFHWMSGKLQVTINA